ncbi:thermonuclease family protein [Shumkonia mesophila]|uniref:thermonuclease family protein n=1 Tax=Shumkonia mesophila TaxID=2838854 RepID=UPI002934D226|nr:thermonuclease family protein [Shumkonia mesophila]
MADTRETIVPLFESGRRRRRPGCRRPRGWEWGGLLFVGLLAGLAVVGLRDVEPAFPLLGGHAWTVARPESLAIVTRFDGPPAQVTGGDTLKVEGERIRLFGVDAPESGQACTRADGRSWPCGAEASAALKRLVAEAGGQVSCIIEVRDAGGWAVSTCEAGGLDLGAAMVRSGLALAGRQYSARYAALEAEAKHRGAGLWAGSFEAPWDWRRANPE